MAEDKLPLLRQAVQEEMDFLKEADPHIFDNGIPWDLELDPAEITVELAETLEKLEPFGKDNERPKFMLREVSLQGVRFMGADETHARFTAVSRAGHASGLRTLSKSAGVAEPALQRGTGGPHRNC